MRILIFLLLLLTLSLAGFGGYKAYQAKVRYDAAVNYLFGITNVADEAGQGLTRAQLLDLVLTEVVTAQQQKQQDQKAQP